MSVKCQQICTWEGFQEIYRWAHFHYTSLESESLYIFSRFICVRSVYIDTFPHAVDCAESFACFRALKPIAAQKIVGI